MESVVYLLGAGFSAPLGLPVMSNFLEKSKDLYFSDPRQYRYFEDVLETIEKMSVVKNYYSTDLFNIEEVLSILAMQHGIKGKRSKQSFLRYIADVIIHYTPVFQPQRAGWPSNWHERIFAPAGELGASSALLWAACSTFVYRPRPRVLFLCVHLNSRTPKHNIV